MMDGDQLRDMQAEVVTWAKEKGWWDDGRTFGDEIALIHSELSEALEAFRDYGFLDVTPTHHPEQECKPGMHKPEGVASEIADTLIRMLHTCALHDIDLFAEFRRKMDYNWTRTYRHGGRAL